MCFRDSKATFMDHNSGAKEAANRYGEMLAKAAAEGRSVVFAVRESDRFNEWAPSHRRAVFAHEEDARRAVEVLGSHAFISPEMVEGGFEDWYARIFRTEVTVRHVRRR